MSLILRENPLFYFNKPPQAFPILENTGLCRKSTQILNAIIFNDAQKDIRAIKALNGLKSLNSSINLLN